MVLQSIRKTNPKPRSTRRDAQAHTLALRQKVLSMPLTKAEVYSRLIKAGVSAEFLVVPEYRIKPSLETKKREADLAWCITNPREKDGRPWIPVGVFEIEGHDVELRRANTIRGIEKDADSILAAARYVRVVTGTEAMPAAAVVLFQLSPDGRVHNSPMVVQEIAGHRERFARHAADLYKLHSQVLPRDATKLGMTDVLLDDELDAHLSRLVDHANCARRSIQEFSLVTSAAG